MQNKRLLVLLLILLTAKIAGYAFSKNEVSQTIGEEITVVLSQDRIDSSTSYLTTKFENFNNYVSFISINLPVGEDIRLLTKFKAYYNSSRFLKPGLSLLDILYPFHTFL